MISWCCLLLLELEKRREWHLHMYAKGGHGTHRSQDSADMERAPADRRSFAAPARTDGGRQPTVNSPRRLEGSLEDRPAPRARSVSSARSWRATSHYLHRYQLRFH